MAGFIEGAARGQSTLLPECLDDWVAEDREATVDHVFVSEVSSASVSNWCRQGRPPTLRASAVGHWMRDHSKIAMCRLTIYCRVQLST